MVSRNKTISISKFSDHTSRILPAISALCTDKS